MAPLPLSNIMIIMIGMDPYEISKGLFHQHIGILFNNKDQVLSNSSMVVFQVFAGFGNGVPVCVL